MRVVPSAVVAPEGGDGYGSNGLLYIANDPMYFHKRPFLRCVSVSATVPDGVMTQSHGLRSVSTPMNRPS